MRRLTAAALCLLAAAAPVRAADPPAPAYVPFVVDEAHYQALRQYLDQQAFAC